MNPQRSPQELCALSENSALSAVKKAFFIILLAVLIANLAYRIDLKKSPHELIGELAYFPSGVAVRALSLGFYAPLADLVWLRFIQYYGEHRMSDVKFDLMYHILDVLTTLDMRFTYAYTLGALMLTHDANHPEQAKTLLRKGMYANPDDWLYPFMYAFIHYTFLKDYRTAQSFYRLSAQKPEAPIMAKRWAAFVTHKKLHDWRTALAMWTDLYNNTDNQEEKDIAAIYIIDIKMNLDMEFLTKKVTEFQEKIGREPINLRELIAYGIIDTLPQEPHGERYYLKGGKIYTTWKRGVKKSN